MASGNVSNNPLKVVAEFYYNSLNDNAVENANYVQTQASLESALPLLPTNLKSQLAPLVPYLNNDLGTIFNNLWATVQTAEQNAAASIFTTQANNNGASINSVTCTLAPAGILIAETIDAEPPAQPPILSLSYQLPGGNFHFERGSVTAWFKLDFDAAFVISTPVPVLPFSLTPTSVAVLSNAALHPDSFWADVGTAWMIFSPTWVTSLPMATTRARGMLFRLPPSSKLTRRSPCRQLGSLSSSPR